MNPDTQHNLLLVDDDRLVLVTLAQGLSRAGYQLTTAESADDAEALLAGGYRPDLAILDVNMPGKTGLELAERLRLFDHIPFMLLTAYSDQKLVEQAETCGALGYLVKPIDTPQLIPSIELVLHRVSEQRRLRSVEQQLQQALDNERDISVAIGITMMQYHLNRKAAFELLRKTARNQRRKLAELAKDVVDASISLNLVG